MPIFKNVHKLFRKNISISIPCFVIFRLLNNRETIAKTIPIVLQEIVIACLGIFGQFLYPVQEFRLKNDTLKNGTSRIGLYGNASPGRLLEDLRF